MLKKNNKLYLAGHSGLLGTSLLRLLKEKGFRNIIVRDHADLDLTRQAATEAFFKKEKPDYCILAAARVGGIFANKTYTGQFIYDNLMIEANVLHAALLAGVKKLLFFASACSYPRECPQPMKEEFFLTGAIEPTNIAYAVAKIAGVTLCQSYRHQYGSNFICAVPTNSYGPGDNFDPKDAHVIPALIRKFHDATIRGENEVVLWGSGAPVREFIYCDDLASASLFLLEHYNSPELINVGSGQTLSIRALAEMIKEVVGFKGRIRFDSSKPDGAPRKVLDSRKIHKLGWKAKTHLEAGIRKTYIWFLNNEE